MPLKQHRHHHQVPSALVLAWYDRHGRHLPWRVRGPGRADPYAVWLSEIMLQQTSVAVVIPYFEKFLARWPTVTALAAADLDDVLRAWAGLGYYARARNLHQCAGLIAAAGGTFPGEAQDLAKLPGIGPYTAAAIAAIAFDRPANVVDGNVERVMARYFAVTEPLPAAKPVLRDKAAGLLPTTRHGDYAQALMDLGATICTPAKPNCAACPLAASCAGYAQGVSAALPLRAPKAAKPLRRGAVFWLQYGEAVLIRRRPPRGLLGGMMELPTTPWLASTAPLAQDHAPLALPWAKQAGTVRHTFTHFHLELEVYTAKLEKARKVDGEWAPIAALEHYALPSVMRKAIVHARAALAPGS